LTVAEALARVDALPPARSATDTLPLVQIRLEAAAGAPDQRDLEERALTRDLRLLQIRVDPAPSAAEGVVPARSLRDTEPLELLLHAWGTKHPGVPLPDDVRLAFHAAMRACQEVAS
jgi:hypothetical protein